MEDDIEEVSRVVKKCMIGFVIFVIIIGLIGLFFR